MTRFSWDERKNRANLRKHQVSFEAAALVFDDPHAIFEQDREVDDEARWQAIGRVEGQVLLLVAHAYEEDDGEETIRIISARRAEPEEHEIYFRQFDPRGYER
ncbi:MAG TPA: BrnT family toxin [Terracidiphilus sp.]|nr:BrnT family toxin [Terracidiphilus sp.]